MSQVSTHGKVVHVIFNEFAKRSCHNVCNVNDKLSRLPICSCRLEASSLLVIHRSLGAVFSE